MQPDATARTDTTPPTSPARRHRRVLLVEDDPAMRDLLVHALEDQGYQVIDTPDGADALALYLWHAAERRFLLDADVVVTDVRMPRVDGLELLAAIQRSDGPVPVVLISAFADATLIEQATRLGAAAVLPKPFSIRALLSVLARILD